MKIYKMVRVEKEIRDRLDSIDSSPKKAIEKLFEYGEENKLLREGLLLKEGEIKSLKEIIEKLSLHN